MVKRIIKIVFWTIIGVYIPVMLVYVLVQNHSSVCKDVSVSVLDSANVQFVSPGEIKRYVLRHMKKVKNRPIDDFNLEEVEKLVVKYPAVASCDAYFTPEGLLRVVVHQRKPVMRVFENGATYLLDPEGMKIPYRGTYNKRLLVVTGSVSKLKKTDGLLALNDFVMDDSFWRAQIEQVFVDGDGDLILVPRVGDHYINVGDASDLEYKFRNLKALYEDGLDPLEWNSFKMINLKYRGQVVCSKI